MMSFGMVRGSAGALSTTAPRCTQISVSAPMAVARVFASVDGDASAPPENVSGEDGEAGVALKTAHPLSDRRVIDTPLSGKPCVTRWRVVRDAPCDTHERVTLVDMWPETGRKHQLRRHAAETLRAPILGDERYAPRGGEEAAAKEDGLFLWAVELCVPVSAMPWLDPGTRAEGVGGKKAGGSFRHDFYDVYDGGEKTRWLRVRVDDPSKFARRLGSSTR